MTRNQLRTAKPGDCLMMSEAGLRQGMLGRATSRSGTVTDVDLAAGLIQVRRDGIKAADWYSTEYWE